VEPKFKIPKQKEIIIVDGMQSRRFNRLLIDLSQNLWKKSFPPAAGAVAYYTVTSNPAIVATILASVTPYQRDDQTWLTDLNICYTVASAARTTVTMSISELTFLDTAGLYQPVNGYAMDGSGAYVHNCYAEQDTGNIILNHASATTTIYGFRANGLILKSKPDFAE